MSEIYPEALSFLYNFIADYILLFFVKRKLYPEVKQKQVIKGALCCSATYIIWDNVIKRRISYCKIPLKWIIVATLLCYLFKIRSVRVFAKTIVTFLSYMFLMGGCLSFLLSCADIESVDEEGTAYKALLFMMISAGTFFMYKQMKKRKEAEKVSQSNIYEVQILRKERTISCQAIYDSGNLLLSEITGQGVCIISEVQVAPLLLSEEKKMLEKFREENMIAVKEDQNKENKLKDVFSWKDWAKQFQNGIYCLQYSTVGKKNAKMPGIIAEEIVVLKNKEVLVKTRGMLGISQEEFSEKNKFSVLLPADIFVRDNNSSII